MKVFNISDVAIGDKFSGTIEGLEFETRYYLAAIVFDKAGNRSKLSNKVSTTTDANGKPVITPENGLTVELRKHEEKSLKFSISDPEGHGLSVSLSENKSWITLENPEKNKYSVKINASKALSGTHEVKLIAVDAHKASSEVSISYTVLKNNPPQQLKSLEDILFNSNDSPKVINLKEYMIDPDGEEVTYEVFSSGAGMVNTVQEGNMLTISPLKIGVVNISVVATDMMGENITSSFKVLVRDSSSEVDLYPNPVIDFLNVRMGEDAEAEIRIVGTSGSTVHSGEYRISPFSPARIDMKGVSAGSYTVIVKTSDKEIKRNIVKL